MGLGNKKWVVVAVSSSPKVTIVTFSRGVLDRQQRVLVNIDMVSKTMTSKQNWMAKEQFMWSQKGLSTASAYLGKNMKKAKIIENRFLFRAVWYVFTRFFQPLTTSHS